MVIQSGRNCAIIYCPSLTLCYFVPFHLTTYHLWGYSGNRTELTIEVNQQQQKCLNTRAILATRRPQNPREQSLQKIPQLFGKPVYDERTANNSSIRERSNSTMKKRRKQPKKENAPPHTLQRQIPRESQRTYSSRSDATLSPKAHDPRTNARTPPFRYSSVRTQGRRGCTPPTLIQRRQTDGHGEHKRRNVHARGQYPPLVAARVDFATHAQRTAHSRPL